MIIVRLLSPGPWLVGTTKAYSGIGADIVMESITPIDLVVNLTHRKTVAVFRDDVKDCGEKSGVAP